MAGYGVNVYENPTSLRSPVEVESAIQVVIGTAPVNMTKDPAVNVPVLANTYAEAVSKLGYTKDFKNYTICQSISASFVIFNLKPVIFINVLDPEKHNESVVGAELSVSKNKAMITETVNDIAANVFGVILKTVVVKSSDGSTTYEADTDYVTAFDEDGYTIISIIPGGNIPDGITQLNVDYEKLDPSAVTPDDIIGGYDASTGKYKGIECISQVYPRLGIVPCLPIAPGWSQYPAVAMALVGKTEFLNGNLKNVTYVDIDTSASAAPTYDKAKEWKDNNSYTSEWMYPLYGKPMIGDQVYYFSAIAAALTGYVDSTNSGIPAKSPSNKMLRITGLVNEAGNEINLDKTQSDYLNDCGIATAVNSKGWKLRGNYTAAYPGDRDPKNYWLNYRRLFAWDANNTVLTFDNDVDEPISHRLIQTVVSTKNLQGNGYVAAGNMAAYRCEYLPENNPITDIISGKIKFGLKFAPYPPAQEIIFYQELDLDALEASLNGGAS